MKKILLFFAALAFAFSAMAETESFVLSSGTFTTDHTTWTMQNGNITMTQLKGSASTAVSSNYIASPRIYKGHVLEFTCAGVYSITKVEIVCNGTYFGNSIVIGDAMSSNAVTSNTTDFTFTADYTSGGTHVFETASEDGTTHFYIQNVASATNTQLRPTAVKVTYVKAATTEPTIECGDVTFGVVLSGATNQKTVSVEGANLSSAITATLASTANFSVSGSLTTTGGDLTVACTATAAGDYNTTLTLASGSTSKTVNVSATVVETEGDGSETNPFTLADVKLLNNRLAMTAWVQGTIACSMTTSGVVAETAVNTNIVLVEGTDTVPVQLPTGEIRTALNIVDHAENIGAVVAVYGSLEAYMSKAGVKTPTDYRIITAGEVVNTTAITLDQESLSIEVGKKDTLVATVTPANSTEAVVWSTSDAAVATVSKGIVTAVAAGTATITATSGEFNATCAVTVTAPVVPDVTAPTISPASGRFKNSIEVTITAEEGMVIFYTIDGSSPEDFINEYSAPITLTQTATVKAIALNPENEAISSVAEVTYTKIEPMTCAQAAAVEKDGEIELGQVTVAYVNYKNIYVVDATGAYLVYDNDSLVCGLKEGTTALKAGDVVTGLAGVSSPYKNLPEMKVTSAYDDLTVVAGTAPASTEMTTAPVAADVNKIVVLKNVLMTAAGSFTTSATTNLTGKMGETDVTIRNNFRIAQTFTAATYYDITCAVAIYNTTMQVYFISATQVEATVTSIAISGTPTKLTYEAGEAFDPAGLTVTATYNVGSTADVTASAEWTLNPATLAEGDTQCEVTATVGAVSSEAYTVTGLTVTAAVAKSTCTFDLSTASYDAATTDQVKWSNEDVRMVADKASASTVANNYVPAEGNSYTSSRFYKSSKLTIRPEVGVKIMSIEYTATTEGYATALKNSTWTNATAAVSADNSKLVVITPTDGTAEVVATIGATTGASGVTVTYVKAESMTVADAIDAVTDMAGDATAKSDYVTVTGYVTAINGTTYTIAETVPAAGAMKRVAAASETTLDIINPAVKNSTDNLPVVGTKVVAAGYLTEAGMVDATLQGVNENGNATAIDAVEAEGIQKVMRDGKVIIIKNGVEYSVMGQKL